MYWTEYKVTFNVKSKIKAEKIINQFDIFPKISFDCVNGKNRIRFVFTPSTEDIQKSKAIKNFLNENKIKFFEEILELNNIV